MAWVLSAALNFVIAICYFAISGLIIRGLVRAGELRTNRLGLATAGIVLGWAALSRVSIRDVYRGVAEASVYVAGKPPLIGVARRGLGGADDHHQPAGAGDR